MYANLDELNLEVKTQKAENLLTGCRKGYGEELSHEEPPQASKSAVSQFGCFLCNILSTTPVFCCRRI